MRQIFRGERGSMLLESLISATLLMVTVVTVMTFMHRALKSNHIHPRVLAPPCERPVCARSGESSSCTCGSRTSLVVH